MKITEVNLTENITHPLGLSQVSMKKIGDMVLLAGKNGSGKTRILNLIKQQASNLPNFISQQENAKNNIKNWEQEIEEQHIQKLQIEKEIENCIDAVNRYKEKFKTQTQLEQQLTERSIKHFELRTLSHKKQIEDLPKRKELLGQEIEKHKFIAESPIPIICEKHHQNIAVIDFVPNRIELEDWVNHSKMEWMNRANTAKNPGIFQLYQATIPLIQQISETYFNITHPMANFSKEEIEAATSDYERLQNIINSFLGLRIGWDKHSYSTLFGKPIAEAQLSAGQKVLLQLCVAIFAQGGNLEN